MNDSQLLRYSRHILLDEIGIEGQQKLLNAHVLVVGAGGLGSPAALYLASAGVGKITLVDDDHVDATNLQRQIAHRVSSIGRLKAESIAQTIADINPDTSVSVVSKRGDAALFDALVAKADLVLDCTDNFTTRHLINRYAVAHKTPLVSGAAIRFDGQVSVYDCRDTTAPCYACLFPETEVFEETSCATLGIFAPIVGIVGSVQACEALKLLMQIGHSLSGRLLMLDGRAMQWTQIEIQKNPDCSVCANSPTKS